MTSEELLQALNPSSYDDRDSIEITYNSGYKEISTSSSISYDADDPARNKSVGIFHWIRHVEDKRILRYMRYINVILALFQGLTGFLGLFDLITLKFESFLVASYVIIFAVILLLFEIRFQSLESLIRDNFGFLFTYRGRAIFMLFIGGLDFAMSDSIAWLAGLFMCSNACFHGVVLFCHPAFKDGRLNSSMDPTVDYKLGKEEAQEFIHQNPQIASKAGAFALKQTTKNPHLIEKIALSQLSQRQ